jgi:hypothetical protein
MLMAMMSVLRLAAASISDAEWLLPFQPASPSRVLLLMESQSLWRSSLASRDGLVWRSPQWLQNSPESKLKGRLRMARPSPQSPAKMSMSSMFRRQPPLVSQTFSEAHLAAALLPLSFLREPFLSPGDRQCFPSRDQPQR